MMVQVSDHKTDEIGEKIQKQLQKRLEDRQVDRVFWLMSDKIFEDFQKTFAEQASHPIYVFNLRDIHPLRTRSCNFRALLLSQTKKGSWSWPK